MVIRAGVPDVAVAIARVHVDSWRSTYRGLLPDSVLANLSVEQRAGTWRQAAETALVSEGRSFVLVAEDAADGIIGFAAAGLPSGRKTLSTVVSSMRFTCWSVTRVVGWVVRSPVKQSTGSGLKGMNQCECGPWRKPC